MKRLFILLSIIGFVFASDIIPFDDIQDLAQRFVNQKFGFYYLDEVLTYYGLDELPNAYAMVYRNTNMEPFTIVVGARLTCTPISEFSKTLPNYYKNFEKAKSKARDVLKNEPSFEKIYYFGPQEEYFCFESQAEGIFVNTYSLEVLNKEHLLDFQPEKNYEIENIVKDKWKKYLSCSDFKSRYDGYVDSVPFVLWSYGCSPTAASMLLWYWDSRGYGRLVDHFFDRWDIPYNEWHYNLPNVIRELALAMYTDSTSGGTSSSNIIPGYITTANSYNGYSFTGQNYGPGNAGNQYCFSYLKSEIDNQRPFHWSVYNYYPYVWPPQAGHSLTGVGYDIILPDTFVVVHNTWDTSEHSWALWTYHDGVYSSDYVRVVIPGGSNSNNLFLDFPQGTGVVFKNLKYYVKWHLEGTDIDHLKIWYSIGKQASSYDSLNWFLIEDNVNAGDDQYLWIVPDQDSALRVNISGLNPIDERLAADGSIYRTGCVFPNHSSNLDLVGHYDTQYLSHDVIVIGDYAYIANGNNGLIVADVSDSSLPEEVAHLPLPGNSVALSRYGSNLYLLDEEDTLRIISISTPTSPSQIGKCALGVDLPKDVFAVDDTLVYVAGRGSGIFIFNVKNPSSPSMIGSYDTPGQCYAVLVSDTLCYVGDGVKGLRVLNVADPANPEEIGFYDTNGITQGLALKGNIIYLAEGGQGIKTFDVTDPTDPQPLGSLDTPGIGTNVLISDSLFVADGSGGVRVMDVSDPSNPIEVEYLECYGTATNLAHVSDMLYLADGSDGFYIIHEDIPPGIEEIGYDFLGKPRFMISSPQIGHMKFALSLNRASIVSINIYDVSGRLFKAFCYERLPAGEYEFDLSPHASGVYFIQAKTDQDIVSKKVVFLR